MTHNMTVTVEEDLWDEMKKHSEIRWSQVMKEAAREKIRALVVLNKLMNKNKLSEKDINEFALKLSKKISGRK